MKTVVMDHVGGPGPAAPSAGSTPALRLDRVPTPIGPALVVTDDAGRLRALDWPEYEARLVSLLRRHYGPSSGLVDGRAPASLRDALDRYFAGELDTLTDIGCATGGTPFQRLVWAALRDVPAGSTITYSALAARVGRPAASRAVGMANGTNPIGVVVPCHRVVGADGSLTGYAGGLDRKRWLLRHESAWP